MRNLVLIKPSNKGQQECQGGMAHNASIIVDFFASDYDNPDQCPEAVKQAAIVLGIIAVSPTEEDWQEAFGGIAEQAYSEMLVAVKAYAEEQLDFAENPGTASNSERNARIEVAKSILAQV